MYFMTCGIFIHKLIYVRHGSLTALELEDNSINFMIIDGVSGIFL